MNSMASCNSQIITKTRTQGIYGTSLSPLKSGTYHILAEYCHFICHKMPFWSSTQKRLTILCIRLLPWCISSPREMLWLVCLTAFATERFQFSWKNITTCMDLQSVHLHCTVRQNSVLQCLTHSIQSELRSIWSASLAPLLHWRQGVEHHGGVMPASSHHITAKGMEPTALSFRVCSTQDLPWRWVTQPPLPMESSKVNSWNKEKV